MMAAEENFPVPIKRCEVKFVPAMVSIFLPSSNKTNQLHLVALGKLEGCILIRIDYFFIDFSNNGIRGQG